MNRTILLLLTLIVIVGTSFATYYINNQKSSSQYQPGISEEFDQAVKLAREHYGTKAKGGTDFRSGPCLDENLLPDWVGDIVHNPRVRSDDLPENQCLNYLTGKAKHFVELDVEGNVVRVQ